VYVPTYEVLNQLVDLYEIEQGYHAIEGNLDAIIFNPVATTIQKMAHVQTSEMDTQL
jgi:hypothetical protein